MYLHGYSAIADVTPAPLHIVLIPTFTFPIMCASSPSAYGGGIAIQYNNTYFPDSGVINRFAVDTSPEVTLTCIATEGNGRLFWQATDDRLASILGTFQDVMESIGYSIVLEGVTITVDYPVPQDVIKLTISNVTVYSDTFKCSSEISHIFTSVFVTTGTIKNIVIQSVAYGSDVCMHFWGHPYNINVVTPHISHAHLFSCDA